MVTDPGEIRTSEDLQRALAQLYKDAGISYQKLAGHQGVTASHNTINDWVRGKSSPQWANLAPVLRAWNIADSTLDAWKAAHQRASEDARLRPGLPLDELRDPFALEVHEPITAAGAVAGPLPPYVRRAHDERLAEVVSQALEGSSGIAVLVADSSAGKTRALWEALAPLRAQGGWRLWHPSPYRPENLREQLGKVGPRTVVWLNDTQRYFLPLNEQDRGLLAEQFQAMLLGTRRAPILVMGSLWREHYKTLCPNGAASGTRKLLDPAAITVPENFLGADFDAVRAAAGRDPRLKVAYERAENGKITQYLAGGPELVRFYEKQASMPGRAVIEAAMDLVRMGHPNALPFTLLRDTAAGYIDDITWDSLEHDSWFQTALEEISQKCRGARGPVTRFEQRPLASHTSRAGGRRGGSRRTTPGPGEPSYQLADYLDQHARRTRGELTPPLEFWEAAAAHAAPDCQYALACAGWDRGLYRDAAQLWKNAASRGRIGAGLRLVTTLSALFPDDHRPADWAIAHVDLDDPRGVAMLLGELDQVGAVRQAQVLAERAAAHIPLDDPEGVADVLQAMRHIGADPQVQVLADRAAAHITLDDPGGAASLLDSLRYVGAHLQVQVLADRVAAQITLDKPGGVAAVLDVMRQVGADLEAQVLADRAAAHITLDDPGGLALLLDSLRQMRARPQVRALADRAAACRALDDPGDVAKLLESLWLVGESRNAQTLADRAAVHVTLDKPIRVAELLSCLWFARAHTQAQVLADRAAAHVPLGEPIGVAFLLKELRRADAHPQAQVLADRAAGHIAFDEPDGVAMVLDELREADAHAQIQVLVNRAVTHNFVFDNHGKVAYLLNAMRRAGAHSQAQVLASRGVVHHSILEEPIGLAFQLANMRGDDARTQVGLLAGRAADDIAIDDSWSVAVLLRVVRQLGGHSQAGALADRVAVHMPLDDPSGVADVLKELMDAGAHLQVQALAGRLPGAGCFSAFLQTSQGMEERFRFGREPYENCEPIPADPWSWSDLD